ncbi:Chain length determinant protein [Catalinimonas alkaloidigena]|uniref:Chain length determinant protein n=1 Tax=Catalinimonas alkaloidigena TaxID=1075417 RepID=A0A1G8WGU2_9BACT|nr:hypothetical protein [Catalinimonas alkaloidigena]SDJ77554.1 Chain length determinant protein [Catalinimonas alkaloidigena]
MPAQSSNLIELVHLLKRWRKHLIIITGLAALGSLAYVLLLPNYYRSRASFIPYSAQSLDPRSLASEDPEYIFGDSRDLDRTMAIGTSAEMFDSLIQQFDLYQHYKINADDPLKRFRAFQRLSKHLAIETTERDAVAVTVEDTDRELAARMANAVVDNINAFYRKALYQKESDIVNTLKESMAIRQSLIDSLQKEVAQVRKTYGIFYDEATSESSQGAILTSELTRTYLRLEDERARLKVYQKSYSPRDTIVINTRARIEGYEAKLQQASQPHPLLGNLQSYAEGSDQIRQLSEALFTTSEQMTYLRIRYQQAKAFADQTKRLSTVYVIENAVPADKKHRPLRSLLVIGITFAAFLFSVMAILVIHYYQNEIAALRRPEHAKNR